MKKLFKLFSFVMLVGSLLSLSACSFNYTESYAVSMKVLTLPTTRTYAIDDKIDIAGLTVALTYIGGKVLTVTPSLDMIEYDTSKLGKSAVKVFFEKVSTTFEINVVLPYYEDVFVEVKNDVVNQQNVAIVSMKLQKETNISSIQLDFVYDKAKFTLDSVLESSSGISYNHIPDSSMLTMLYTRTDMTSITTKLIVFRLLVIDNAVLSNNFSTRSAYRYMNADYSDRQRVEIKFTIAYTN